MKNQMRRVKRIKETKTALRMISQARRVSTKSLRYQKLFKLKNLLSKRVDPRTIARVKNLPKVLGSKRLQSISNLKKI